MTYKISVFWEKKPGEAFVDKKYSRSHTWMFDGGIQVAASSSPHVVPLPMSSELAVDPEEAFIASLSSCHMLWFLSIAAEKNYIVESYEDHAEGILGKDQEGRLAMTQVTLKPRVVFSDKTTPSREQIEEIHHMAHEECYIANSVKTPITIVQS